jgi:DNA-directed RNA polymerase subunit RPC12/RpoP
MGAYQCRTCGTTNESEFYAKSKYYCKPCWNRLTYSKSREKLDTLIDERGGRCERCGYDRCRSALQWHHRDPLEKEFAISGSRGSNIDKLRAEVSKCELLCANCHAEVHAQLLPNPTARARKLAEIGGPGGN